MRANRKTLCRPPGFKGSQDFRPRAARCGVTCFGLDPARPSRMQVIVRISSRLAVTSSRQSLSMFFLASRIDSRIDRSICSLFIVTCSSLNPGVVWYRPDSLSSSQAILRTARIRVGPGRADIIGKGCVEIFGPGQAVGFFQGPAGLDNFVPV